MDKGTRWGTVMLFMFGLLVSSSVLVDAAPKVGDKAPEFVDVRDLHGRKMQLKSYRGRWTVLTFGASWCKPCKKELPAWDALAKKMKKQPVVFVAINIDKQRDRGRGFMAQAKLRWMHAGYEPSGRTVEAYRAPAMPATYIIGPQGIIRYLHKGYRSGDSKKLANALRRLRKGA